MSLPSNLTTISPIIPLQLQQFESYLPTAFNDELTILQKLNKAIQAINDLENGTNGIIDEWNSIIDWINANGLTDMVNTVLTGWKNDGTLDTIINQDIFGSINTSITTLTNNLANMRVWTSVKEYGTVGDGNTPDDVAIQNALTNKTHVYIPEGTYKLNAQLTINKNTHLKMHPNARLLRCHNDDLLVNYDTTSTGYNGQGNIIIEGGILDCNGNSFPDVGTGISLAHGDGIIVRDLSILDTPYGHALEITGSQNVLVDNVKFLGFLQDSTHYYVEAIQIETSGPPPTDATYTYPYVTDGTTSKNVIVQNCHFAASSKNAAFPAGVGSHGAIFGHFYDNIVVKNNHFEGCSYWAIRPFKWRNAVIDGNKIENGSGGGIYITTPNGGLSIQDINHVTQYAEPLDSFVVTNNIIDTMSGTAIYVQGGDSSSMISDVVIKGNVFKNIGINVIDLDYVSRCIASENSAYNIGKRFVDLLVANHIDVHNNQFYNSSENGFFAATSNDFDFLNNHVNRCNYYGFNISGDCANFTIKGNRIYNISQSAANTYDGILVTTGVNKCRIVENVMRTSGGYVAPRYGLNLQTGVSGVSRYGNDLQCGALTSTLSDLSTSSNTSGSDIL